MRFLIINLLLLFCYSSSIAKSLPTTSLQFIEGMNFGAGLDLIDHSIRANSPCLKTVEVSPAIRRNDFRYSIQKIENIDDLVDKFGFGLDAKMKVNLFSVNISGEFVDNFEFDSKNYYMAISIDLEGYDYNLINPTMTAEALSLYEDVNSYDLFRAKCGDKFLDTITVGGKYVGVLTIKTSNMHEKEKLDVELSGFYGVDVAGVETGIDLKGTLLQTMEKIEKNNETSINIIAQGGSSTNVFATTMEQFIDSATNFINSIATLETDVSKESYTQSPIKVRFEKYDAITPLEKGGSVDRIREILDKNQHYNEVYSNIIFDIDSILTYPYAYDGGFEQKDTLIELKKQLFVKQSQLRYQSELCMKKNPTDRICLDVETIKTITFPKEWELRSVLPLKKVRYPKTCKERKELFPSKNIDKEYRLYMNGDKYKYYSIYCSDMDSDSPQEYLTLQNSSFLSLGATKNYIYNQNSIDKQTKVADESIAVYSKLKVKVSDEHLSVYSVQDKFIDTIGVSLSDIFIGTLHNKDIDSSSRYNIDIAGTNFEFGDLSIDEVDYSDKIDVNISNTGDINSTLENNQKLYLESTKPFSFISFDKELILKYKEN